MKFKFLKVLLSGVLISISSLSYAGIIVDPVLNGGKCCSSSERGYFFTATEELNFTSFWLNTSAGLSTDFNLDVILLSNTPPEYSGSTSSSTTAYTTLGSWDGLSGLFTTDITIATNSIIGFLAYDNNLSTTPYADAFSTNYNGNTINFTRLIRQSLSNGAPVAANGNGPIGAIGFTANTTAVPEPSTLAIFALGIMGLASRRFKKH
jgi:hypothetical protein